MLLNATPLSCEICLLTSSPLCALSVFGVFGCIISSSSLKTTGTLSLGYFMRPSAPSGLPVVVCAYFAIWLFQRLTILAYFVYVLFHVFVNPSAFVLKVV